MCSISKSAAITDPSLSYQSAGSRVSQSTGSYLREGQQAVHVDLTKHCFDQALFLTLCVLQRAGAMQMLDECYSGVTTADRVSDGRTLSFVVEVQVVGTVE